MSTESVKDNMNIFRAFSEAMHHLDNDSVKKFMEYIDENCEWVLMATGETFRGIKEIRPLGPRSMDAIKHTNEARAEFTNAFSSEDQRQMCVEYTHGAIITEEGARSLGIPAAAGRKFDIKICLVCHVKNGKFDRVHEYYDLKSLVEGPSDFRLYP